MGEKKSVGKVTHYFSKIGVAVIELSANLGVGDKISIEGPTTNLQQTVESMQIEHKPIQSAKSGQAIGMKVADKVREGDDVFLE
jgi:translation elongation factor EF-1alpha